MNAYSTLISADQFKQQLDAQDLRVFDCRYDLFDHDAGPRAYAAGHIPGAFFADIGADLSGSKSGSNGRHPLPDREQLSARFRAWGVNQASQIVVYDAHGGQFAGRLWWLARWLGHAKVALLDGGWQAWLAAGGASSVAPGEMHHGNFSASASLVQVASVEDVQRDLGTRHRLVIDARAPERYSGAQEPVDPVGGHIPGAANRPWPRNLAADGRFKSPVELKAEFTALAAGRDAASITHQCGSGVTACHNLLAMEVAGLPGAQLYAGSWSEWVSDPQRPIATGVDP